MLLILIEMIVMIAVALLAVCVGLCFLAALAIAVKKSYQYLRRQWKQTDDDQLDDNQQQVYTQLKRDYPKLQQTVYDYQNANHNLRVANDEFQVQIQTLKKDIETVSQTKILYETRIQHLEASLDQANQLNATLQAKLELDNQYRPVKPATNLENYSSSTSANDN